MRAGDVISYLEMCQREGAQLQRGMNYRLHRTHSVLLMSVRANAPYADRVENDGRILIYEGHDEPRTSQTPSPKELDQPLQTRPGRPTQNGLFHGAAREFQQGKRPAERVHVYEKIRDGIWVFNGMFLLTDAWVEHDGRRNVCKFRLELVDALADMPITFSDREPLDHDRVIPPAVKVVVWKRDKGRCVRCGSQKNLHFDHILPFSKGGSSLLAENIQLLCAEHNLEKSDRLDR